MNWLQRYRLRSYLQNSLWIMPVIAMALALSFIWVAQEIELVMGWRSTIGRDVALAVLGTIAASTFGMVVVFTSAILVSVQLASAQLTPRIITLVYRTAVSRLSLAVFVFTFTFAVATMIRIRDTVPLVSGYIAAYTFLLNIGVFIYFLERMGKFLKPSSALNYVAKTGREVIHNVYPELLTNGELVSMEPKLSLPEGASRTISNEEDGVVLAFDLKGLVLLAQRSHCIIQIIPAVGEFVAQGSPLFRIFEGGSDITDATLRSSIALGPERTMRQDPAFAFRILVDIATKALSPAINDPTTAVLAIDQLHHLLRDVGRRSLRQGQERDQNGQLRLIYRTFLWEDFVQLSVTECRQYGRDSIQVMRRLRAMLENLIKTLPAQREPLLQRELELLAKSSRREFPDSDDQQLADTGDPQGMGCGYNHLHNEPPSLEIGKLSSQVTRD